MIPTRKKTSRLKKKVGYTYLSSGVAIRGWICFLFTPFALLVLVLVVLVVYACCPCLVVLAGMSPWPSDLTLGRAREE